MPKRIERDLKPKLISKEFAPVCNQFMRNLLAYGFRITDPSGKDITEELIEEAAAYVRAHGD